MSSDMFMFHETNYYPDEISSNNFFTDPISTLSDSSIDSILQEISDDQTNNSKNTQILPQNEDEQITLETLSLQQGVNNFGNSNFTHLTSLVNNSGSLGNVYDDIPEVKTEEFQPGFDFTFDFDLPSCYFIDNGGGESENMLKFMQRSYSSNSFDVNNDKAAFLPPTFLPRFDPLLEVQNFYPDCESGQGHIRRVCSTGNLPKVGGNQEACTQQTTICSSSSPSLGGGGDSNLIEESNFKLGRYNAEERKERINRYKAKRTQRNFNKTIKYACRKTLADNRPRIRGRFARNDDSSEEIPKPTCLIQDHHHLWVDNNLQEEDERRLGRVGGGRFMTNFGATQFKYCGY